MRLCIDVHGRAAKQLGVSREELAEVATIAAGRCVPVRRWVTGCWRCGCLMLRSGKTTPAFARPALWVACGGWISVPPAASAADRYPAARPCSCFSSSLPLETSVVSTRYDCLSGALNFDFD